MKNPEDKNLVSACGLYCGACGIYLATQENDPDRLLHYALVLQQSFDDTLCDGCGSGRKSLHCKRMCTFLRCKEQKEVEFCADCADFPCPALLEFRSGMPHRAEIIDSLTRMKETGTEQWLEEMKDRFSCPHCRTVNSAYHPACRKCGNIPGSSFVFRHEHEIRDYLSE